MKTIKFKISGNYGHFKIPYTNNNPLTYSFIPKTALIGFIGAVVGIERNDFKRLFPILSKNLKYSLSINNEFRKESISTYSCNFNNYDRDRPNRVPRPMEYIKNPNWTVYITLVGDDIETKNIFDNFCYNIENEFFVWKPTLGIKQCDCVIDDVLIFDAVKMNGDFETKTFITNLSNTNSNIIFYNDNIPTHQDSNWFSDPKFNISVFFVDNGQKIKSSGDYYKSEDDIFVLI